MADDTQTYTLAKPVGQGSWGGYGYTIEGDKPPVFVPGPGSDPFAAGRLVNKGEGYEIDWDAIYEMLWEDRAIIGLSAVIGIGVYSVMQEPEKYGPPLAQFAQAIAEAIKGIGEVIPG